MRIMFYGAAQEVTGSCFCVESNGKKTLIDCGLQQGSENEFRQDFPFHAGDIDKVVITHAHIDHTGRLPLLVKQGFKGKIYATEPTCKLMEIMLRDSAFIQETEAGWRNRKNRRSGEKAAEPLYTIADAEKVFPLLIPCHYNELIELGNNTKIRFTDAGHLLGSSYVEMWLSEKGTSKKLVFSGDIGVAGHPMICDPTYLDEADYVIMESTYGNRNRPESYDTVSELAKVIESTLSKGGNVICPAFAIGRTQDLLYYIREIKEKNLTPSIPDFPVYLDSPLATAATKIYSGDLDGYLDEHAMALINDGVQPLAFDGLNFIETSESSKSLNDERTPKVIISSSGMCDAGRVRHHLKHNLWRRECAVVFTGFQANGTLGRIIVDELSPTVTLFGEEIAIRCKVYNFRNMSAHADFDGLVKWINAFETKPLSVFLVHGEDETCKSFANHLTLEGFNALVPKFSSIYDLATNELIFEGREFKRRSDLRTKKRRESAVFNRLMLAGTRLIEVIAKNREGTNKDLAKFADQIDALANKWDK